MVILWFILIYFASLIDVCVCLQVSFLKTSTGAWSRGSGLWSQRSSRAEWEHGTSWILFTAGSSPTSFCVLAWVLRLTSTRWRRPQVGYSSSTLSTTMGGVLKSHMTGVQPDWPLWSLWSLCSSCPPQCLSSHWTGGLHGSAEERQGAATGWAGHDRDGDPTLQ